MVGLRSDAVISGYFQKGLSQMVTECFLGMKKKSLKPIYKKPSIGA